MYRRKYTGSESDLYTVQFFIILVPLQYSQQQVFNFVLYLFSYQQFGIKIGHCEMMKIYYMV